MSLDKVLPMSLLYRSIPATCSIIMNETYTMIKMIGIKFWNSFRIAEVQVLTRA